MRLHRIVIIFSALVAIAASPDPAPDKPLLGFTADQTTAQRELEAKFDSFLNADNLRNWMKRLTAHPHHVGSPWGKENAEFIAGQFKSWGYDTKIETFHVLFPTPKIRSLEMIEPTFFKAELAEPELKEDATSGQKDEQLPSYNAYSVDGDVTGELVYVNYGVPDDYEELERRGIDVTGKIVIARYGGSWRGIKPKVAAEKGAIGCILYSDPRNDGYYQGDVYPKGSFKNDKGVQRGSVEDMPIYPGDPLTPGVGATKDAKRLEIKDAPTLTKIPVLPISHSDALPLLQAMEGPVAPENWRGALPITYHLGPGATKVRLKLEFNWNIEPAYDVIATMKGSDLPDQWIIRGNHHDAWANGANDPTSGMVALMEEARGIAELAKNGWRPKRTIIYCAWDAEEPGLLGSTEWAEHHAEELKDKAAIYINTDSNGRGFLRMSGSHTLEKFINQVARDVTDPQKGIAVFDRLRAARMLRGSADSRKEAQQRKDLRIGALGSGSDYTPFLQHLGIACLNLGYGGENAGGEYHSIYDSFDHYTRFGDPKFEYGIALAKTAGRAVLRLVNADILPFEFQNFTNTVSKYVEEVMKLTDDMRVETERENRLIREGTYKAVFDPTKPFVMPEPKDAVPHLNFAPLQNAFAQLERSAGDFEKVMNGLSRSANAIPPGTREELDRILYRSERFLTREAGLPRRPWFKHHIYAPGFYTGYGVKTLPGIREAIEQRNWKEAEEHIQIAAEVLKRFSEQIDEAAGVFKSVARK
jgi:N-acetylated-alpha-linked acidic dipeptidase